MPKRKISSLEKSTASVSLLDSSNSTTPESVNEVSFDWQASKSLLSESFHHLFENKINCDVEFLVGSGSNPEKIAAHKLVLSARSIVFTAMFSKNWSTDNKEIKVLDVEPPAFKDMLRFVYSDDLELTRDTVTAVIYAAKKYAVVALEDHCSTYLSDNLCSESVFAILIRARHFHLEKLTQDCLDLIAKNTDVALKAEDFLNIDLETLCLVLERSDLRIEEILLFDAVDRWAEAACVKNNCSTSSVQKRQFLKNALHLLRFPVMKLVDFTSKVIKSGLLLEAEVISVFLYHTSKAPEDCIFSCVCRSAFFVVNRFRNEVTRGMFGSSIRPFSHSIQFSTSHNISLVGVGLYGTPDRTFQVKLSLTDTNTYTTLIEFSGKYYCADKIFRIIFCQPCRLSKSRNYELTAYIKGQHSTYGYAGVSSVIKVTQINNEEVNFRITFEDDVKKCSTCKKTYYDEFRGSKSDVFSGQFPELLFDQ